MAADFFYFVMPQWWFLCCKTFEFLENPNQGVIDRPTEHLMRFVYIWNLAYHSSVSVKHPLFILGCGYVMRIWNTSNVCGAIKREFIWRLFFVGKIKDWEWDNLWVIWLHNNIFLKHINRWVNKIMLILISGTPLAARPT